MRNSLKILLLACTSLMPMDSFAARMTPRELIGEVHRLRIAVAALEDRIFRELEILPSARRYGHFFRLLGEYEASARYDSARGAAYRESAVEQARAQIKDLMDCGFGMDKRAKIDEATRIFESFPADLQPSLEAVIETERASAVHLVRLESLVERAVSVSFQRRITERLFEE